jgi:hypothetical protein
MNGWSDVTQIRFAKKNTGYVKFLFDKMCISQMLHIWATKKYLNG